MSNYPMCSCPAQPFPYECSCIGVTVRSEESMRICKGETLVVDGLPRDYDRDSVISMWVEMRSMPQPSVSGFFKGAVGATKAYFNMRPENLPQIKQNFETCSACDFQFLGRCRSCGCPIGSKVWEDNGKCPEGFW